MIIIRIPQIEADEMVVTPPQAWTIRIEGANAQAHTFACQERDGCYISSHTKLAGWSKRVVVSTQAMAQDFCKAIYPVMRKRHGDDIQMVLEGCDRHKYMDTDDDVVLVRLRTRNFVPNVRPAITINISRHDHKDST